MENHQIQFILKSMLGLSLAIILTLSSVSSSPIQTKYSSTNAFQPIASPAVEPQPQALRNNNNNNNNNNYQYNPQESGSERQDQVFKTYNPNFVTNFQQLTKSGAEIVNIRPTRRTILSTLMAPFMNMREQAMNMLGASLQGCNSGTQSMWCRFWGMFLK